MQGGCPAFFFGKTGIIQKAPFGAFVFGGKTGIFPSLPLLSPRFARCPRRRKRPFRSFSSASLPPCSNPRRKNKKHLSVLSVFGGKTGIFPSLPLLSPRFARCPRRRKRPYRSFPSASLPPCSNPRLLYFDKNITARIGGYVFM